MSRNGRESILPTAIKNLFSKPATTSYAGIGEPKVERNYRGKIIYDPENCIACGICMRDCPTGAIKVINEGTKTDRKMKAVLDLGRCIFCCQCVDSCPKDCLSHKDEIIYAGNDRDSLKVDL